MKITPTIQALYDAVLENMRTNSAWAWMGMRQRVGVKNKILNISVTQEGWMDKMFIVLLNSHEAIEVRGIGNKHQFYLAARDIQKNDEHMRKLIKQKQREQEWEHENALASKTLLDFMKK